MEESPLDFAVYKHPCKVETRGWVGFRGDTSHRQMPPKGGCRGFSGPDSTCPVQFFPHPLIDLAVPLIWKWLIQVLGWTPGGGIQEAPAEALSQALVLLSPGQVLDQPVLCAQQG